MLVREKSGSAKGLLGPPTVPVNLTKQKSILIHAKLTVRLQGPYFMLGCSYYKLSSHESLYCHVLLFYALPTISYVGSLPHVIIVCMKLLMARDQFISDCYLMFVRWHDTSESNSHQLARLLSLNHHRWLLNKKHDTKCCWQLIWKVKGHLPRPPVRLILAKCVGIKTPAHRGRDCKVHNTWSLLLLPR